MMIWQRRTAHESEDSRDANFSCPGNGSCTKISGCKLSRAQWLRRRIKGPNGRRKTNSERGIGQDLGRVENRPSPSASPKQDATKFRLGEVDENGSRTSGGKSPRNRTKSSLYEQAKKMGIEGRSKMSKNELAREIRSSG